MLGFDADDVRLLARVVLAGALLTSGALWTAGTLGAAWRVFMAMTAGG